MQLFTVESRVVERNRANLIQPLIGGNIGTGNRQGLPNKSILDYSHIQELDKGSVGT
jgi:hypothetical protein